MTEEKGSGIEKYGKWFCSENCLKEFDEKQRMAEKPKRECGCCH